MDSIAPINDVLGILSNGGIGVALLIMSAAALVWWRTRSVHPVMLKIWSFFVSRNDCSIKSVKQFHEKQAALLQFRFTTGLSVRTLVQVEDVLKWTEKFNEDVGDVAACGDFFDLDHPGLKDNVSKLKWWMELIPVLFVTFFLVATLLSVGGIFFDRAILRLKETRTWMTLGDNYVKRVGDYPGFKIEKCNDDKVQLTPALGFTERELQLICTAFSQQNTAEFVRSTVAEQKLLFKFSSVFCILVAIPFWKLITQLSKARAMYRRLHPNKEVESIEERAAT